MASAMKVSLLNFIASLQFSTIFKYILQILKSNYFQMEDNSLIDCGNLADFQVIFNFC